jgi:thiazole/oxazole-forming peptide maturase SagC family component
LEDEKSDYLVYTGSELREYTSIYITRFLTKEQDHITKHDTLVKLKDSSLTLVGLGSLGSYVLLALAPLGIGKIRAVDHRTVNHHDVKHGFFLSEHLGEQRCAVLRKIFDIVVKRTRLEWYPLEVESTPAEEVLGDPDLIVSCSDQSLPSLHNYLNESCLKRNISWLSARFYGYYGEVGPTVIPYMTPCYKCYEYRVQSNIDEMRDSTRFENRPKRSSENELSLIVSTRMLSEYVSLESIKMLTKRETPKTIGAVLSIDFQNYRNTLHRVLKVPYCPACGQHQ